MRHCYQIGQFCFEVEYEHEIQVPVMFQKFEVSVGKPVYSYQILFRDFLPVIDEKVLARREDAVIYQTSVGEDRLLGIRGSDTFYAWYHEIDACHACITLQNDILPMINIDPVFTSLFALERRMACYDCFVLHCAYMKYHNQAILFSAPSETGKTTQANLWAKYRGSETINGDRSLLSFVGNQLTANGWPVCGSSEVCENQSTPVQAIVMLSQAKENTIELLPQRKAMIQLYSQITVNGWNQDQINQAMDFIEKIIKTVPVYHLGCTISPEAVECLENALKG